jgi:hypothetical protein
MLTWLLQGYYKLQVCSHILFIKHVQGVIDLKQMTAAINKPGTRGEKGNGPGRPLNPRPVLEHQPPDLDSSSYVPCKSAKKRSSRKNGKASAAAGKGGDKAATQQDGNDVEGKRKRGSKRKAGASAAVGSAKGSKTTALVDVAVSAHQHDLDCGDGTRAAQSSTAACSYKCDSLVNCARPLVVCTGRSGCRYKYHVACAEQYVQSQGNVEMTGAVMQCRNCMDRKVSYL